MSKRRIISWTHLFQPFRGVPPITRLLLLRRSRRQCGLRRRVVIIVAQILKDVVVIVVVVVAAVQLHRQLAGFPNTARGRSAASTGMVSHGVVDVARLHHGKKKRWLVARTVRHVNHRGLTVHHGRLLLLLEGSVLTSQEKVVHWNKTKKLNKRSWQRICLRRN